MKSGTWTLGNEDLKVSWDETVITWTGQKREKMKVNLSLCLIKHYAIVEE
jgi:hypothetical protein